jgi:hypothetical protein
MRRFVQPGVAGGAIDQDGLKRAILQQPEQDVLFAGHYQHGKIFLFKLRGKIPDIMVMSRVADIEKYFLFGHPIRQVLRFSSNPDSPVNIQALLHRMKDSFLICVLNLRK